MTFAMYTASERPDLWQRGIPSAAVWQEYNLHGDVLNRWWGYLDEELPDFEFVLYDEALDDVGAEGHTGPLWREERVVGQLAADVEQVFTAEPELIGPAARALVESHFPDTAAPDILIADGRPTARAVAGGRLR